MAMIIDSNGLINSQFRTIVPGIGPDGLQSTITRIVTITAEAVASTLAPLQWPTSSPSSLISSPPFPSPDIYSSYVPSPASPTGSPQIIAIPPSDLGQQQQLPPHLDPSLPHTDLGPLLNAVFWTLTILALIFLLLRIHIKLSRATISLWWDDHLLVLSWVALAVSASTTSACVALDYGKHLYDIDPANLPKMPFIAVFAGFFSVLAAAWSKTSFALTLLRLAKSQEDTTRKLTGNWMKWLIWAIIISVNAILGVAMLNMWIKCWPIQKIWDGTITEGWCMDPQKIIVLYQWSAGWSGAMDIVLALCPWVLLWKLTMTRRDKVGVAVAMSMGVVAGAASFVKMSMLPGLAGDPVDSVAVTLWGGAEGAITIMAASLPVLRTLFNKRKEFTPMELPVSPGRGSPRDPMDTDLSDHQDPVHRLLPMSQVERIQRGREESNERVC